MRGLPEESGHYSYGYDALGRLDNVKREGEIQGILSGRKTEYVIDLTKQYHNLLQKEEADPTAGTYFALAREYMPSAGRFISRDEDKFISIKNMQSINLYHYCMSNPVWYIDPSGNDEMGHVFGIGDGYPDSSVGRPDANKLGLIDYEDVMEIHHNKLKISNIDIGMLILAYSSDEYQVFADYAGYKQSQYFHQEGKK